MKGCDRKRQLFHGTPLDIPYNGLMQNLPFSTDKLEISSGTQPLRSARLRRPMQLEARDCRSRTSAVGRGHGSAARIFTTTGDAVSADRAIAATSSKKSSQPLLCSAGGQGGRKGGEVAPCVTVWLRPDFPEILGEISHFCALYLSGHFRGN